MKKKTEIECYKKASDSQKTLNARVLPVLCRQLYKKGMIPIKVKRLSRDILNIIGHGSFYNAGILNRVNYKMVEPYKVNQNVLPIFDKKDLLSSILSIH